MSTVATTTSFYEVLQFPYSGATASHPETAKSARKVVQREGLPEWAAVPFDDLSRDLELALQAVCELARLQPNWDGYGSPAIGRHAIGGAISVLAWSTQLDLPRPHVVPVPGGGVQLEWQRRGNELEIEIDRTGIVSFLATGDDFEEEGPLTLRQPHAIVSLLGWLANAGR